MIIDDKMVDVYDGMMLKYAQVIVKWWLSGGPMMGRRCSMVDNGALLMVDSGMLMVD